MNVVLFYWYFKVFSTDRRQLLISLFKPMTIKIFSLIKTDMSAHLYEAGSRGEGVFLTTF